MKIFMIFPDNKIIFFHFYYCQNYRWDEDGKKGNKEKGDPLVDSTNKDK